MTPLGDDALDRLVRMARQPDLEHPRYQFGELIASGGMGSVYRARDRLLDRDVAIKVLRGIDPHPSLAARLDQEARILGRLDHPGLVPVHDAGQLPDGRPFYVMRLVRGERLDHHLRRAVGLPERLRIFLKVCEPVAFAHAHGVVHRDLKPANIMVGPFGEVLVLDWGVAKVRGAEPPIEATDPVELGSDPPGTTGPGAVLGTEGFMAPEQAAGRAGQVDERADIYSLGAVLGDMLREPERAVPRPVAAIRDRAMATDPAERYPSVTVLTDDVGRYLDGNPVLAYRENLAERAARFLGRHRAAAALIAAYVIVRLFLILYQRQGG